MNSFSKQIAAMICKNIRKMATILMKTILMLIQMLECEFLKVLTQ